jgi:hypothetical protein
MKITMKNIKWFPLFWWNYLLIWLATKKIISIKLVNKIAWRIEKSKGIQKEISKLK